jgi:hypothetical protein
LTFVQDSVYRPLCPLGNGNRGIRFLARGGEPESRSRTRSPQIGEQVRRRATAAPYRPTAARFAGRHAVGARAATSSEATPANGRRSLSELPVAAAGPGQAAPLALPGRRRLTGSAGGPEGLGNFPGSRAWAVRDCSSPLSATPRPAAAGTTAGDHANLPRSDHRNSPGMSTSTAPAATGLPHSEPARSAWQTAPSDQRSPAATGAPA